MKKTPSRKLPRIRIQGEIICPSKCSEDTHSNIVQFRVPGVKKENIKFYCINQKFHLIARKENLEYISVFIMECETLPDKIQAKYDRGLLNVVIPRICE